MSAERARRHKSPRYHPAAPGRADRLILARLDRTHPSWCRCTRCTPPGPADRGPLRGCAPALGLVAGVLFVALRGTPALALIFRSF
ncbi:hypothetical protein [Sphingomonas hengshuiensis]|uniref:Uncharacterized protein n=1 Tax=Sphingomonas hengshuiensis TaxID=1609977 RepID=A0A7U4LFY9_9SPHN|nr:hypothetical protein [Sphingomonas hengshuiensis]AJP72950.1 hypothetical protein TS85_15855 [Sphingomonas hengshuiensis]